ncbi:hypothetical protein HispidOSU_006090 [Sigmodon hispidus]
MIRLQLGNLGEYSIQETSVQARAQPATCKKSEFPKATGSTQKGEGNISKPRKWREPGVHLQSPSARAPGRLSRRPFVFGTLGCSAQQTEAKRSEPLAATHSGIRSHCALQREDVRSGQASPWLGHQFPAEPFSSRLTAPAQRLSRRGGGGDRRSLRY